jgi:hypothetical protein
MADHDSYSDTFNDHSPFPINRITSCSEVFSGRNESQRN